MESKPQGHSIDRRRNGAYYTPEELARVLVEWAIDGEIGRLLDPSCGEGVFLKTAVDTLERLGAPRPTAYVYGVDIDARCTDELRETRDVRGCHSITSDFLSIVPSEMKGVPFRAIVGNPPYVRHHWLKGKALLHAREAARQFPVTLPARSSTWAYFILHAIAFLEEEGSLAMVIPEALLQTDYGRVVQKALKQRFKTTKIIRVQERIFHGTDEVALVMAANGRGPGDLFVCDVVAVNEVASVLKDRQAAAFCLDRPSDFRRCYHPECFDLLQGFLQEASFSRFDELAKVQIGLVTGANRFFIFNPEEAEASEISAKCFKPVITRTKWLKGLDFNVSDREELFKFDGRSMLCIPNGNSVRGKAVQRWIEQGKSEGISKRYKCRVREPWYVTPMNGVPDAFVTCCRAGFPRLVLNSGCVLATNALHVVKWNDGVKPDDVAVGFLTTVSAAYAELYGRWYGGGVLKIEPSLLKKVPIPLVEVPERISKRIDKYLREGNEDQARTLADKVVLEEGLGFSSQKVFKLRKELSALSKMRKLVRRRDPDV